MALVLFYFFTKHSWKFLNPKKISYELRSWSKYENHHHWVPKQFWHNNNNCEKNIWKWAIDTKKGVKEQILIRVFSKKTFCQIKSYEGGNCDKCLASQICPYRGAKPPLVTSLIGISKLVIRFQLFSFCYTKSAWWCHIWHKGKSLCVTRKTDGVIPLSMLTKKEKCWAKIISKWFLHHDTIERIHVNVLE